MSDFTKAANTLADVYMLERRIQSLVSALEEAKRDITKARNMQGWIYGPGVIHDLLCAAIASIEKALKP